MKSEKPYKISVQSARWYNEEQPEESMRFIKECGFEAIDYSIDSLFRRTFDEEKLTSIFDKSVPELEAYYKPMKESAEANGISIGQAHGALVIYYDDNPKLTEYMIKVTEKMFAACHYLGCSAFVIHPWIGSKHDAPKEKEIEVNLDIYRRLMPAAKEYGIKICLENLWERRDGTYIDAPCITSEEACWYIDKLNREVGMDLFGFCLDIGHVLLYKRDVCQFMRTMGNRIVAMHLHENDRRNDTHMIPYTQMSESGEETVLDWQPVIDTMKEINYQGNLSFETAYAITMLPCEVKKQALQLISSLGRTFRGRLEA